MPSAKVTFKDGRRIRRSQHDDCVYWHGDYATSQDIPLTAELAEIIQEWRFMYSLNRTPAPDIRATLSALEALPDDEIRRAVTRLDGCTDAELCGAIGRLWRNEHPDGEVPHDMFMNSEWQPDRIREAARYALARMPRRDGRPLKNQSDFEFSKALTRYWMATTGKRPSVTVATDNARESAFLKWAHGMFFRAGRRINVADLAKVLRLAVRMTGAKNLLFRG